MLQFTYSGDSYVDNTIKHSSSERQLQLQHPNHVILSHRTRKSRV